MTTLFAYREDQDGKRLELLPAVSCQLHFFSSISLQQQQRQHHEQLMCRAERKNQIRFQPHMTPDEPQEKAKTKMRHKNLMSEQPK